MGDTAFLDSKTTCFQNQRSIHAGFSYPEHGMHTGCPSFVRM